MQTWLKKQSNAFVDCFKNEIQNLQFIQKLTKERWGKNIAKN